MMQHARSSRASPTACNDFSLAVSFEKMDLTPIMTPAYCKKQTYQAMYVVRELPILTRPPDHHEFLLHT